MDIQRRRTLLSTLFVFVAIVILIVAYFSPMWWVALKAPQYPASVFPDGIRINFHFDGVFNGCQKQTTRTEVQEDEALNCKHEMDAINHYVGMYPMAAGAPVERAFSQFMMALVVLMLITFVFTSNKQRLPVLIIGCLGIAIWMGAAFYTKGGVTLLSPGYVSDLLGTMDLDADEIQDWTAFEAMKESYHEALGRYFRDMKEINQRSEFIMNTAHIVFWLFLAALVVLIIGVWRSRLFYWLLILIPIGLPVFFIIEYAGWLWWFGHNLSSFGAFTVKQFMPTVFGVGKVAQFSTYSYPYYGFALLVIASALLILAAMIRKKQLQVENV